jgi:hypothetical protein
MERRTLIFVGGLILVFLISSCAPPNRQVYYGTWTNDNGYFKKTVRTPAGVVENYYGISDTVPSERITSQIVDCWSDSEGNTWFKTQGTVSVGPNMKNAPRVQTLEKINKSGTVLEVMVNGVVEFNPSSFPTKMDQSPQKLGEHLYRAFDRALE